MMITDAIIFSKYKCNAYTDRHGIKINNDYEAEIHVNDSNLEKKV